MATQKKQQHNEEPEDLEESEIDPASEEEAKADSSKDKKSKKPPTILTTPKRVKEILENKGVLEKIRKTAKRPSVVHRHLKVLKKMSENVSAKKRKSQKEIAVEEGYSESYAETGRFKKTDAWQKLLAEHPAFNDLELARHHDMLMNATKIGTQIFSMGVKDEEIIEVIESFGFPVMKILFVKGLGKVAYYAIADHIAKKYALEMAYKLKQKYGDITIHHEFGTLTDEQIEEEIAAVLSEALSLEEGEEEEGAE